jgi:cytochrome c oxidase assembly protein subunit 15
MLSVRNMIAFTRFAWAVLGYNLAVVAWGAFVRATGSGAGCGKHWPTCNGEIVPRSPRLETAIEFTHRATSGLALLLVLALAAWAFRAFPRGHAARKAAAASLAFLVAEALVGAALVLFGWVATDPSAARGWVMAVHLANTFLLLASLALTADWGRNRGGLSASRRGGLPALLAASLLAVLLAGVTGAVAALGDTLYPATSFAAGLRQELSGAAGALLRLRVLHPFAAIAAAAVVLAAARAALRTRAEPRVRRAALAALALVALQMVAGVANVLLLAPVAFQIGHLVLADLTWLALVLLASAAFAPGEAARAASPLPSAAA